MFAARRTISSSVIRFQQTSDVSHRIKENGSNIRDVISDLDNKTECDSSINHEKINIPYVNVDKHVYASSAVIAPISSSAVAFNSVQSYKIGQSFDTLKSNIIKRGKQYAGNTLASRRGYISENFVADTYNIDATIKKIDDRAKVPESHDKGSPDIIYDNGNKKAQAKFYKDASSSAKAQASQEYQGQKRIVPSDQVNDGIKTLNDLANKNDLKGRKDAANIQRETASNIDSTIKGAGGAESTPLSKEQSDSLSKAFDVDENGNIIIDESKIDKTLDDTGVTDKVKKAKLFNELRGVGIAAAIGLGTGLAIGMLVSLAQNGLNPESLKYAVIDGAKQGAGSAVMSAGGAVIGIAAQNTVESIAQVIISKAGLDATSSMAQNIYQMCDMGIVGILTIMAMSVYTFTILKIHGYSTKEALIRTGKSALLSLSILLLSVIAQGLYGGLAGVAVSIVTGIIMTGYTLAKIKMDKDLAKKISYHTIELLRPDFAAV